MVKTLRRLRRRSAAIETRPQRSLANARTQSIDLSPTPPPRHLPRAALLPTPLFTNSGANGPTSSCRPRRLVISLTCFKRANDSQSLRRSCERHHGKERESGLHPEGRCRSNHRRGREVRHRRALASLQHQFHHDRRFVRLVIIIPHDARDLEPELLVQLDHRDVAPARVRHHALESVQPREGDLPALH